LSWDVGVSTAVELEPCIRPRGEASVRSEKSIDADDDIGTSIIEAVPRVTRWVFLGEALIPKPVHLRVERPGV